MTDTRSELDRLRDTLTKSQQLGQGYAERVSAIQARIAELEEADGTPE